MSPVSVRERLYVDLGHVSWTRVTESPCKSDQWLGIQRFSMTSANCFFVCLWAWYVASFFGGLSCVLLGFVVENGYEGNCDFVSRRGGVEIGERNSA